MRISISLWCHLSSCDPARSWQDPQANDFALCGNYKKKLLLPESRGDFPPTPFLNHSLFKGEQVSLLGITKAIKPVSGSVPFLRSVGKTQGQLSEAVPARVQHRKQEHRCRSPQRHITETLMELLPHGSSLWTCQATKVQGFPWVGWPSAEQTGSGVEIITGNNNSNCFDSALSRWQPPCYMCSKTLSFGPHRHAKSKVIKTGLGRWLSEQTLVINRED